MPQVFEQSLFLSKEKTFLFLQFEDCFGGEKGGGRPKAAAAAEALRRVHPGVRARAEELRVPMPGHPLGGTGGELEREARESFSRLDQLVQR